MRAAALGSAAVVRLVAAVCLVAACNQAGPEALFNPVVVAFNLEAVPFSLEVVPFNPVAAAFSPVAVERHQAAERLPVVAMVVLPEAVG